MAPIFQIGRLEAVARRSLPSLHACSIRMTPRVPCGLPSTPACKAHNPERSPLYRMHLVAPQQQGRSWRTSRCDKATSRPKVALGLCISAAHMLRPSLAWQAPAPRSPSAPLGSSPLLHREGSASRRLPGHQHRAQGGRGGGRRLARRLRYFSLLEGLAARAASRLPHPHTPRHAAPALPSPWRPGSGRAGPSSWRGTRCGARAPPSAARRAACGTRPAASSWTRCGGP